VRFAAIPMGHEFTSLVLALLQVGGHTIKFDDAVIEQIRNLDGDYEFETFMSLTCHNCPDVVQALNAMSVINPRIKVTTIDGGLFPQEVEARQIMAVPMMFLNGQHFGQGRTSSRKSSPSWTPMPVPVRRQNEQERRVRRADRRRWPCWRRCGHLRGPQGIRTGVLAERFGGQVLDTLAIENFISVKETEGPKFAIALEQHVKEYDVDIMNTQRAAKLVPGKVIEVQTASGAVLKAKSVILATGARWREINVPGEKEYRNHGVAYCPHCDGPLFKGKRVAVIGGGNSGVEAAIDLAGLVQHVTLIEFGAELRADAVLQQAAQPAERDGDRLGPDHRDPWRRQDRQRPELQRSRRVRRQGRAGRRVRADRSGAEHRMAEGTVALSRHGEIEIDSRGQTSVPGVFAAGDVTTVPYKQIIIATGEGAKAALSAFDHLIRADDDDSAAAPAARRSPPESSGQ
jgi:alkyl hydroperoxide reductase subunit F